MVESTTTLLIPKKAKHNNLVDQNLLLSILDKGPIQDNEIVEILKKYATELKTWFGFDFPTKDSILETLNNSAPLITKLQELGKTGWDRPASVLGTLTEGNIAKRTKKTQRFYDAIKVFNELNELDEKKKEISKIEIYSLLKRFLTAMNDFRAHNVINTDEDEYAAKLSELKEKSKNNINNEPYSVWLKRWLNFSLLTGKTIEQTDFNSITAELNENELLGYFETLFQRFIEIKSEKDLIELWRNFSGLFVEKIRNEQKGNLLEKEIANKIIVTHYQPPKLLLISIYLNLLLTSVKSNDISKTERLISFLTDKNNFSESQNQAPATLNEETQLETESQNDKTQMKNENKNDETQPNKKKSGKKKELSFMIESKISVNPEDPSHLMLLEKKPDTNLNYKREFIDSLALPEHNYFFTTKKILSYLKEFLITYPKPLSQYIASILDSDFSFYIKINIAALLSQVTIQISKNALKEEQIEFLNSIINNKLTVDLTTLTDDPEISNYARRWFEYFTRETKKINFNYEYEIKRCALILEGLKNIPANSMPDSSAFEKFLNDSFLENPKTVFDEIKAFKEYIEKNRDGIHSVIRSNTNETNSHNHFERSFKLWILFSKKTNSFIQQDDLNLIGATPTIEEIIKCKDYIIQSDWLKEKQKSACLKNLETYYTNYIKKLPTFKEPIEEENKGEKNSTHSNNLSGDFKQKLIQKPLNQDIRQHTCKNIMSLLIDISIETGNIPQQSLLKSVYDRFKPTNDEIKSISYKLLHDIYKNRILESENSHLDIEKRDELIKNKEKMKAVYAAHMNALTEAKQVIYSSSNLEPYNESLKNENDENFSETVEEIMGSDKVSIQSKNIDFIVSLEAAAVAWIYPNVANDLKTLDLQGENLLTFEKLFTLSSDATDEIIKAKTQWMKNHPEIAHHIYYTYHKENFLKNIESGNINNQALKNVILYLFKEGRKDKARAFNTSSINLFPLLEDKDVSRILMSLLEKIDTNEKNINTLLNENTLQEISTSIKNKLKSVVENDLDAEEFNTLNIATFMLYDNIFSQLSSEKRDKGGRLLESIRERIFPKPEKTNNVENQLEQQLIENNVENQPEQQSGENDKAKKYAQKIANLFEKFEVSSATRTASRMYHFFGNRSDIKKIPDGMKNFINEKGSISSKNDLIALLKKVSTGKNSQPFHKGRQAKTAFAYSEAQKLNHNPTDEEIKAFIKKLERLTSKDYGCLKEEDEGNMEIRAIAMH